MSYIIESKKSVKKDIKKLPQAVLKLIEKKILNLSIEPIPPGAEQLKRYSGFFRIMVSNYRILYQVEHKKKKVIIYKIGHRKEIYRHL